MSTMRWLAVALMGAGLVTACKDSKGPDNSGGPSNLAPDAKFSFDCAALLCDFRDGSTDDGAIASWSWKFGDAAESADPSPVHSYASAGGYTVSLTVTDDEGETSTQSKQVQATDPLVTSLSCENPDAPGAFVHCTLKLEADVSGFEVVLNSTSCTAHGNIFRVTNPVQGTLTSDGCYEQDGKTLSFAGPFPSGTEISAEVEAPLLEGAPGLHVTGQYPVWNLTFEDGEDADFNDLVMTLRALP